MGSEMCIRDSARAVPLAHRRRRHASHALRLPSCVFVRHHDVCTSLVDVDGLATAVFERDGRRRRARFRLGSEFDLDQFVFAS